MLNDGKEFEIFTPIISEIIIPIGKFKTVFSEQRIIIQVQDEAAGPYLMVKGWDDDMADAPDKFNIILNSHLEINELCEILHQVLYQAEKLEKEKAK